MHDLAGQLRLLARDEDDVAVVSALLQDAIIPGADMEFKRKTSQFHHCCEPVLLGNPAA
jgi:hypothetical protein